MIFEVSTKKKGRKTAWLRVAHCCKSCPFFFRLIPQSSEKILDFCSYRLIFIVFQQRKNDHSNSFKRRIISILWRCRDTYDVTIMFFGWCKNRLNFLNNQNKRYAITLFNIDWYCFLSSFFLFSIMSKVPSCLNSTKTIMIFFQKCHLGYN